MLKIDQKDRKLLYEIDLNARLGTSTLGTLVSLSQEGVFYRLRRLEERKIITGYMALINFGKLGYTGYAVYSRFQNVTAEQKEKIIEELKQHNHIYWIAEFGGKYDLAFALMARNVVHFNEIFLDIATKYQQHLKDLTIAIRAELVQFHRKYLQEKKETGSKSPHFGRLIEQEEIDKLDQAILSALAPNARISILELAKKIGRPASTVQSRLKQLEKKKILQGYSAHIHSHKLGYQSFQLFLNTHNITKDRKKALFSYCSFHPNIIFYIETVGKWNFEIIYEVETQQRFQELLIEIRTKFADIIADIESIVIFNHYVKYNQYPLKIQS